jgi:DNA-binding ferritin-like protein
MKELKILLRSLQLYAHMAHNLCARVVFQQDHEFFASVYEAADNDFDAVMERCIGLYGEDSVPSLTEQLQMISAIIANMPTKGVKENSVFYMNILDIEQKIVAKATEVIKSGATQGTTQLLGDICNRLEVEMYKIKQRVRK